MSEPTCAAPDCSAARWGRRDYCRKHQERINRNGTLEKRKTGPKPKPDRGCAINGCVEPHKGYGYCRRHLDHERAAGRIVDTGDSNCAFPDCGRTTAGHSGLCEAHRLQQNRGQRLTSLRIRVPRDGTCPGPGCGQPIRAGGYCGGHYYQASQGYELTPIIRDAVPRGTPCMVDGCGRASLTQDGVCRTHYRYRRDGDADWQRPIPDKAPNGTGHVDAEGYRLIQHDGRQRREHHVRFEQLLGRPLLPTENVHHRNGHRADNRTVGPPVMDSRGRLRSGNLELWSTSQPAGQEIGPKVEWALDLLGTYRGFLSAAQREHLGRLCADGGR